MINPDYFASNDGLHGDPQPGEEALWAMAAGELISYANHLERTGATITAAQIRLAVHRANRLAPDGRKMDVGVK